MRWRKDRWDKCLLDWNIYDKNSIPWFSSSVDLLFPHVTVTHLQPSLFNSNRNICVYNFYVCRGWEGMWQISFPFSIPHACSILHIRHNITFFFFFYFPLGLEETLLKSRNHVVILLFTPPPQYLHWLPVAYKIKSQLLELLHSGFFQPLFSGFWPNISIQCLLEC